MSHRIVQYIKITAAVLCTAIIFTGAAFAQDDTHHSAQIRASETAGPETVSGNAAASDLEDLMIACDSAGKEIPLEELDAAEYDGFLFGVSGDASLSQIHEMEQKIEMIGDEEAAKELCQGELYRAASLDVIEEIADPAALDFIEPDYVIRPDAVNDTYYSYNAWMYDALGMPGVWEAGITGTGQNGSRTPTVAVMDTGIAGWTKRGRRHDDLNYRNFPTGFHSASFKSCNDTAGHGTFVTGEIAAVMNNNRGVTGLMPDVKVIPVKIMSSSGGATSSAIQAMRTLIDRGDVDVVNMSFGSDHYSNGFASVCRTAAKHGMILVASAGNSGNAVFNYPASYAGVISVGSVDRNGHRSSFSQHNRALDVTAPGQNIVGLGEYDWFGNYKPAVTNGYSRMSGTSMAAPAVSALAAMAKSIDSSIEHNQFMDILQASSKDRGAAGYDSYFGWGVISFRNAADYIAEGGYRNVPRSDTGDFTGGIGKAHVKVPRRPARGKITRVKRGRTKAQITFRYLRGATYYQVAVRVHGGRYVKFRTYSNMVRFVGMQPGRYYDVKVRGVHRLKHHTYRGKWSRVKTFRTK